MKLRDPRAHVWIIWGLVGSFGLVEAVAWTVGGGIRGCVRVGDTDMEKLFHMARVGDEVIIY